MNRLAALSVAVLLAVTLTGCSAPAQTPAPADAAQQSASQTPAPLVASEPSALPTADAEAAFIENVRDRLSKIRTQIPNATDAQLLAVGYAACERMAAGISGEGWSGIEGETKSKGGYYQDSAAISIAAAITLCPEDN